MEIKEFIDYFKNSDIEQKQIEAVYSLLSRLGEYHPQTLEHSLRVGNLCSHIVDIRNKNMLAGFYSSLHDIGKISIPLELLEKKEGFDERDREIIKKHVFEGYRILLENELPFGAWIALTHHRFQPRFYPTDEEMALYPFPIFNANPSTRLLADNWACLTALADSYDAAKKRKNDKFNGKIPSSEELKDWLKNQYPSMNLVIEESYRRRIFL